MAKCLHTFSPSLFLLSPSLFLKLHSTSYSFWCIVIRVLTDIYSHVTTHHNLNTEVFYYSKTLMLPLCSHPPRPPPVPGQFDYCKNVISMDSYHTAFWGWLLSPGITHLRFICVFACINSCFFLLFAEYYSTEWIHHSLSVSSLIEEFLGCFWFLSIINKATMNISVRVFVWT